MFFLNKKLNYLVRDKEKGKLPFLIALVTFGSIIEVFGLGILVPISQIIINESLFFQNAFTEKILQKFKIINEENFFIILLSLFVIIYISKTLLLIFTTWYQTVFSIKFNKKLSNYFYESYIKKDYYSFKDLSGSEFIRNSVLEIDKLTEFLINNLRLVTEIITLIIIGGFLFVYNFLPSLIVTSLILFFSAIYYVTLRNKILKIGTTRQVYENNKIKFLHSAFGGIKDIKMSFSEKYFFNRFSNINKIIADLLGRNALYNVLPRYLLELVFICIFCAYLLFIKIFNVNLNNIGALLPMYLLAFFRLFPSANKIVTSLQSMRLNKPALDVVYKKIYEYNNLKILEKKEIKNLKLKNSINIKINKFKYNKNSSFQLKKINILIKKGNKIGIIGPSGSGKSTIIELLTNILYLKNGDILLDKKSTKNFVNSWRSLIGYIPQKIYILDDTVKNNICLNEKYKNFKDKYFVEILKKVGLLNWYKKLPHGLNTKISERGSNLSGGEIQRIGIARALIHNPEIMVLDEATSSLDSFTEKKIIRNIFKLKNKTIISVSHRLETLKGFDKIFLIKDGKLITSKKSIENFKNI